MAAGDCFTFLPPVKEARWSNPPKGPTFLTLFPVFQSICPQPYRVEKVILEREREMYEVPPPHQRADSATGTADATAASLSAYETWKGSNVSRGFSLSADVDINDIFLSMDD